MNLIKMIKIDEDDEFNRNDKKFMSSIKIIKICEGENHKFNKNL